MQTKAAVWWLPRPFMLEELDYKLLCNVQCRSLVSWPVFQHEVIFIMSCADGMAPMDCIMMDDEHLVAACCMYCTSDVVI